MIFSFYLGSVGYWAFLGSIYLLWMSYRDFTNNMMVNERFNWIMIGLSISLISHFKVGVIYLITVIILAITFYSVLNYFYKQRIGEIDIQSLTWIIFGFAVMNVYYILIFMSFFVLLTLIYQIVKYIIVVYINKQTMTTHTPFVIVIALSFISTCLLI